jgi:hypothetical protein
MVSEKRHAKVKACVLGGGQIHKLLVVLHLDCFFERLVVKGREESLLGGEPVLESLDAGDSQALHCLPQGSCMALDFQGSFVLSDKIEC